MFKSFKIYAMGLVTGVLLTFGISYADEGYYQLQKMECRILANDQDVAMDMPILNYNGSSYVPLRKFSEIAGTDIQWNDGTINIKSKNSSAFHKTEDGFYVGDLKDGKKDGFGYYDTFSKNDKSESITYSGIFLNDIFQLGLIETYNTKYRHITCKNGNFTMTLTKSNDNSGYAFNDEDLNGDGFQYCFDKESGLTVNVMKNYKIDSVYKIFNSLSINTLNDKPIISNTSTIETQMDDDFDGLDSDKIYKLANGQIWQQTSYDYEYHYAYRPNVVIYKSGTVYKMKVDGCDRTPTVTRLK